MLEAEIDAAVFCVLRTERVSKPKSMIKEGQQSYEKFPPRRPEVVEMEYRDRDEGCVVWWSARHVVT